MAAPQNQVFDLMEQRFFPVVEHIKGFFGFGDEPQLGGSLQPGSMPPPGPIAASTADQYGKSPAHARAASASATANRTRECSPSSQKSAMPSSTSFIGLQRNGNTLPNSDSCSGSPFKTSNFSQSLSGFSCLTNSNQTPSKTANAPGGDPTGRNKNPGVDSPLKSGGPPDTPSKYVASSESNSVNNSPFRQTSSTYDSDQLGSCQEEPPIELEEPDYSSGEKLGRIQFSVSYDFEAMTLTVKIIKAEELAAKDLSGTSDPYVKIMLLPDKKHTLTTNIKRKNLNPRWNEMFAFEGFPYHKVATRTLYLLVLDYDRFSRDDPIGEVCIPLSELDLGAGQTMWRTLQPCKGAVGKLGVLLVTLCYNPAVGCVTVVINKAKDLKAKDINGLSDPYVKIWLMHDGKKVEKKKTEIHEKDLNPVFDESFVFNVPYEKIRQTSLVISVMDYDRMGRNEAIGQLVLGSKSGPMEVKHWNEMFAKSRQNVTKWHILKDFG